MKDSYLLIVVIMICLLAGYFAGRSDADSVSEDRSRIVIDSMRTIIEKKDSLITKKEEEYSEKKKSDSISLFNINRSIKNMYYEIKKQSNRTYSVSDSLFSSYVDSIRSAKGFGKVQY